jgi:hypothetical protein
MIQRVQTLYFSLIALIALLFFNGSFLDFTGNTGAVIKVTFNAIFRSVAGQNPEMVEKLLPLTLIIILIPVVSLITIFIFKNRKIQLKFSLILIVITSLFLIALIHISFRVISKYDMSITPGFKMILPVIILILSILAYRGIRKDDQLVKSYDRLR